MCWTEPRSVSGYIIPRIFLLANGIDPEADLERSIEAGSHVGVIEAVYSADCETGATYADSRRLLEVEHADVMDRVRVIGLTAEIPNDALCFARGFPLETRMMLVDALLAIASSAEGQALLMELYSIESLDRAEDGMYESLRADIDAARVDLQELVDRR
jgi:phosphonate transport system substrate-binding protein